MALIAAARRPVTKDKSKDPPGLGYGRHRPEIPMIWRAGCIIRAVFLSEITKAFQENPTLANLMMNPRFKDMIASRQEAWRRVVSQAITAGVGTPAFSSSLAYYDSYRRERLPGAKAAGRITRAFFPTCHDGVRVDVKPDAILKAVRDSVAQLGPAARRADAITLAVMSPAWVAMDKAGKALTPVVTHQDRRSVETAKRIEQRVGKQRHLHLAGNRPFPGGIASTSWAWFLEKEPAVMRRADLAGNFNTYLHRQLTGARVTDPSNASFTGLYDTVGQSGWVDELCQAAGVSRSQLPEVRPADAIGGRLTR